MAFVLRLEEQMGLCHAATCEVAGIARKLSQGRGQRDSPQVKSSPQRPPQGGFHVSVMGTHVTWGSFHGSVKPPSALTHLCRLILLPNWPDGCSRCLPD